MIQLDALDVHPPLYYILLKSFFNLTFINHCSPLIQIIAARIFSISIFLFTLLILNKLLSIILNHKISYKLMLLSVLFPMTLYYATNIRMYILATFFVTCELFFIYQFNLNNKFSSILLVTIFAACAAWTHYFAAIIAGLLLFYNFIDSILNRKIKQALLYLSSGIAFFISFLPWAMISMHQLKSVNGSYWIKNSLFNYIGVFCYQRLGELLGNNLGTIFALVVLISFGFIMFAALKNNQNSTFKFYYSMITIVFIETICIGLILSLMLRPIFIPRYVFPIYLILIVFSLPILIPYLKEKTQITIKLIFTSILGIGITFNLCLGAFNMVKNVKIAHNIVVLSEQKSAIVNAKGMPFNEVLMDSYCLPTKTMETPASNMASTVQSPKLFSRVYPNIKFVKEEK